MVNGVIKRLWGNKSGKPVYLIRLENKGGAYVELSSYGAGIVSVVVPDKNGKPGNVVLGFSNLEAYLQDTCYIGVTIGPFANRIANGAFELHGKKYVFEKNDGGHLNHSGNLGMHAAVFDFSTDDAAVTFSLSLQDGEDGFPGNRELSVRYSWNDEQELMIAYQLRTDQALPISITNHAYFNLGGEHNSIMDHRLKVASSAYLELNKAHLPSGKILSDKQMLFNDAFIRDKPGDKSQGIIGLNTFFLLDALPQDQPVARLEEEQSGRTMEVYTDYPGMLLYTGEFLQSRFVGHGGKSYKAFDGLCLECQYFPDSPNQPSFPSAIFSAERPYNHFIKLKFGLRSY
ncbi:galactose mutarotase [Sphingobacterium sp. SRCM116780]|uniref:aldose epimerase family protein n=1 Tax=Sphingobacterium sp. SRCM116780 TaxID=2907623 RepID=UPI001F423318|nr:aldose epimerase family protein [Sphingobacterium sp. SRCM116780]UIR57526.1 galactose mutarotase [Sphingobacterium sp. SRCM116780]